MYLQITRNVDEGADEFESVALNDEPTLMKFLMSPLRMKQEEDENCLDMVLTYHIRGHKAIWRNEKRKTFLANLKEIGIEIEQMHSLFYPDLVFVNLYCKKSILKSLAHIHGVNLMKDNVYYKRERKFAFNVFGSKLIGVDVDDPLFKRAPDSLSGEKPSDITSSERIMVMYQVLRTTNYGTQPTEHGILRLLRKNIFTEMFPLHDLKYDWTETGPLSDRQLLARYWANTNKFFEEQPLNLIEKYFGPEVGFYFAFVGHYTKMLIPAALGGFLTLLYGLITVFSPENWRSVEVCNSNITICPSCDYFHACKYKKLNKSCVAAHITYVVDNKATVFFAVVLSLWATIFMETWIRKQSTLAFHWNVFSVGTDTSLRPEFEINAKYKKLSTVTGLWEPYELRKTKYGHLCISYVTVLFLVTVVVAVVIGVTLYYNVMLLVMSDSDVKLFNTYAPILAALTSSSLNVTFIISFEYIYMRIATILTNLENPRTQCQYDNSYTYKRFILSFVNSFSSAFYIAFLKGTFTTYPGEYSRYRVSSIKNDLCDPAGCSLNLCIHLTVVLFVKSILMNLKQYLLPLILVWAKKCKNRKLMNDEKLSIWETQRCLTSLQKFFLISEYQEIAIIYGFVVFFSAALPLAPAIALLHGAMSLRVDSYKLLKNYRRPIPLAVPGLLAWENIFKALTHLGVVVNAFVIAFTMDFIPSEIHDRELFPRYSFFHATLSLFATRDYKDKGNITHPEYCYYRGKRYPPDHHRKYQLSIEFWFELAVKLFFIIFYEHLILALTGILAYAIPDVPRSIRERVHFERMQDIKKTLAAKRLNTDNAVTVI